MTTFSAIGIGRTIGAGVNLLFPTDVQVSCVTVDGYVYLYLPSISSVLQSRLNSGNLQFIQFIVTDISGNASANNIVIVAPDGEKINGADSVVLNIDNVSALIVPTSNNSWGLIASLVSGGSGSDSNFVYQQTSPSDTWVINHNLNKMCAVQIVDNSNIQIEGDVTWDNINRVTIRFNTAISGKALCN